MQNIQTLPTMGISKGSGSIMKIPPHLLAAIGAAFVISGVVAELVVVLVVDVFAVGDPAQPAPLGLLSPQPLVVRRHPAVVQGILIVLEPGRPKRGQI